MPSYGSLDYKVGIIPLRPLGFGEFFDGAFRAIQHNPQVMFGLSLLVALLTAILQTFVSVWLLQYIVGLDPTDRGATLTGVGMVTVSALLIGGITALSTLLLNGLLITSVSQSVLGRKVSISTVWQESRGQLLRLVGLTFLIGLINVAVVIGVMILIGLLLMPVVSSASSQGQILAVFLMFGVMVAGAIVVMFVYTRLAVASPVLMMEKSRVGAAISRSWILTKGYAWRNIGVLLLASLIAGVIAGVATVPIGFVTNLLLQLPPSMAWLQVGLPVFLQGLITALITPFLAAVTALLYVDLRMRKEGLDVALIRAAGSSH